MRSTNVRFWGISLARSARFYCLVSIAADLPDLYERAAFYVDKILKGAKPADLPVEQPTKFPVALNLKTAKALGLVPSPSLLAQIDEVIE